MRHGIVWLILAVGPLWAGWVEVKSGPFVVYSDAGDDAARAALNDLEQFRWVLAQSMHKPELKSRWPITAVVSKLARNQVAQPLAFGRSGYIGAWPAGSVPSREWYKALALILFDSNLTGRMPANTESALADLFSTLAIDGVKVTLGAPLPPSERTLDWARLHMLATSPETSGKFRVLLSNLSQGAEEDPSYRNAFEMSRADIDKQAAAYLAAGKFGVIALSGKPINPERQFHPAPANPERTALLHADLLLAQGAKPPAPRNAYQAVLNQKPSAAAQEGYGLALLAEGDKEDARQALAAATSGEGAGPRAFVELARMEPQQMKAQALLESALRRNPAWGEPWFLFAQKEPGPNRRGLALKKAAELEPRNLAYWQAYAESQMEVKNFEEAAKAWIAADRVAPPEQKARIAEARLAAEQRQLDKEAEEKRRKAQAERDEVEKLRQQNLESIRQAEAKTRGSIPEGAVLEKWWDGPAGTRMSGTLEKVDCLGKQARLTVRDPSAKLVQFVISDPTKVALIGASGQITLSCGVQRPPRKVEVEYVPKPPGAGEVVLVQFK